MMMKTQVIGGRIGADELRHTAHTKAKNHIKIKFNRKIRFVVIDSFFFIEELPPITEREGCEFECLAAWTHNQLVTKKICGHAPDSADESRNRDAKKMSFRIQSKCNVAADFFLQPLLVVFEGQRAHCFLVDRIQKGGNFKWRAKFFRWVSSSVFMWGKTMKQGSREPCHFSLRWEQLRRLGGGEHYFNIKKKLQNRKFTVWFSVAMYPL